MDLADSEPIGAVFCARVIIPGSFRRVLSSLKLFMVAFAHGSAGSVEWNKVYAQFWELSLVQQRRAWKACAKMSFQA
jgi:hypothetical protein